MELDVLVNGVASTLRVPPVEVERLDAGHKYSWAVTCLCPPPSVGDYYYSDGTFSWDLEADKTPVGMVFWVNPRNNKNYRVMSLDEPPATWQGNDNPDRKLKWSAETVTTGASSDKDGMLNMAAIKTLDTYSATTYPAFAWCDAKNTDGQTGWYLPAHHEMEYVWCAFNGQAPVTWLAECPFNYNRSAQHAWNSRLTAPGVGGTELDTTSYPDYAQYWSSSDLSGPFALYIGFGRAGYANMLGNKPTANYVRCTMSLPLPD